MAKRQNKKVVARPSGKSKRSKRVPRMRTDAATAALQRYLALLSDPCGADLTAPLYTGSGSGYFMRTRQIVPLPGNIVDGVLEITPTISVSLGSFARYSATATTGGNLPATATFVTMSTQLTGISACYRPVAGCLKLMYTGSELSRSGLVFSSLLTEPQLATATAPGTGASSAATMSVAAQRIARLGEEAHEVRWVPNSNDENWTTSPTDANAPLDTTAPAAGSTIMMGFYGVPAGSITAEITFVWEWQPATVFATNSIQPSPRSPPHPLGINAVLHKIGDLGSWATDPANHQKAYNRMASTFAFGQGVYNVVKAFTPAGRAAGMIGGLSRLSIMG